MLISGGTGFVGGELVARLTGRGDRVLVLTRNKTAKRAADLPAGAELVEWDPYHAGDWFRHVAGCDAVVHLAGEPVIGTRWNEAFKRRVMDSRVVPAKLLVEAIERAPSRPAVFVTASGVGYYGDTQSPCPEDAPAGEDFLAKVTIAWEGAAQRAEQLGVRVVRARLGIVFGANGGALEQMVKPFKLFAGGPIGSGDQIVSWIHLTDCVRMLMRAIDDAELSGPINVTAPEPVSNAELADCIGSVLHRPSSVKVPAFALKLRFGEGATPLLTGQRAIPRAMQQRGFEWTYPKLEGALRAALA
ncbi:MAG: TIGR01777 family protein [Polyangiaceae bacterium]|nr:TIGR01777 family protein [Polyangiaceae bacterium]